MMRFLTAAALLLAALTAAPVWLEALTPAADPAAARAALLQSAQDDPPAAQTARQTDAAQAKPPAAIDAWLILGPVDAPLPAFHDESDEKFDGAWLLKFGHLDHAALSPAPGAVVAMPGARGATWRAAAADTAGVALEASSALPQAAWLAAWIEVPRWMKVSLTASSTEPFEIFVAGKSIVKSTGGAEAQAAERGGAGSASSTEMPESGGAGSASSTDKPESGGAARPAPERSGTAALEQGKHLLLVKTVSPGTDPARKWSFRARIAPAAGFDAEPAVTLDPAAGKTLGHVVDAVYARGIEVSPDGNLVALTLGRSVPPEGRPETWIEIRALPSGSLVRTIMDSGMTRLKWAPVGRRLAYVSGERLRVIDIETGAVETIIEGLKDFAGYAWGPAGDFIVYSLTRKPPEDKKGVQRLLGIYDRTDYGRNVSLVHVASVPGGLSRQVTDGRHGVNVHDVHPGGNLVIIERSREDLSERPFSRAEIMLLNLADQSIRPLVEGHWLGSASWSPDGRRILVQAGPSAFDGAGSVLPEDVIPNDFDWQLYILDPETGAVEALTKKFDPSVNSAFWAPFDGMIYIVARDGEYVRLFRCDPAARMFTALETGVEVLGSGGFARSKPVAVFSGSGAAAPHRIFSLRLGGRRGETRMILDPNADLFRHVALGRVETWNFAADDGETITGRVHYPLGFDPAGRWPCIVYYYGGTNPVDRAFGGRYPKNLWTAHGYVVYVLQPSGTTGFGQEWSARHVNEWGSIVADEIIAATQGFLAAHPFVDPQRVGCIGASFGGFMTQLLVTRTDIFAAAVSHAGISMIPSYWGEGYWGYSYNAVSAAGSYPWNNPQVYLEQSPLLRADRIETPLLLLHGASDTNVPPGESEQMYTALKILGREVEYLRFPGQNHFILDYKQRRIWNDAIISWFDRWLKDQPQWWNEMYPPIDAGAPRRPGELETRAAEVEGRGTVLFGTLTRESIGQHLPGWEAEYFLYEPDPETCAALAERLPGTKITVVLGTWCPDSQSEVPRLWKILEQAWYPPDEVEMFGVGSVRFSTEMGIAAKLLAWSEAVKTWWSVERVATIIVSRGGSELGRIVETPEGSLEEHLLRILE